jgi:2,3-bisphosphoglycerate-dependent phosphoglycerate mutase
MITATKFTIVRHGESKWNVEGKLQGHLDSGLTESGIAQAKATGKRLVGQRFNALYSSDLGRAMQTAEIIGRYIGLPVSVDQRLREINLGIFEGLTGKEVETLYPQELWQYLLSGPDFVIPGGESARQYFDRTIGYLEDIAQVQSGNSLLVVTHLSVLESLLRRALGIPLEEPRHYSLSNASLNVFFYENKSWILGTWGDAAHLAEIQQQRRTLVRITLASHRQRRQERPYKGTGRILGVRGAMRNI